MLRIRNWLFLLAGIVLLDQLTKALARHFLVNFQILPLLSIHLTKNTGAAFGIFKGANLTFVFISLIVIGLGMLFYEGVIESKEYWCFALIGAGVIGNLIDRIAFGYVTDFIELGFWPTFNIADSAITIGVAAILVYWLLEQFHPTTS